MCVNVLEMILGMVAILDDFSSTFSLAFRSSHFPHLIQTKLSAKSPKSTIWKSIASRNSGCRKNVGHAFSQLGSRRYPGMDRLDCRHSVHSSKNVTHFLVCAHSGQCGLYWVVEKECFCILFYMNMGIPCRLCCTSRSAKSHQQQGNRAISYAD